MVAIKRQIVSASVGSRVTSGNNNPQNYITVHQTGNTRAGANAEMHARLQSNGNSRSASWHYQVDDKEAIQSFEHIAQCWAAGDGAGPGNRQSVHVEICINSDGDYVQAVRNGAELVKFLMDELNLPIARVKQHWDWSRKNCPQQIRARQAGIGWNDFLALVEGSGEQVAGEVVENKPSTGKKTISQMADEVIAKKHGNGHENRRKSLGISATEYEKVRAEVNRKSGVGSSKPAKPNKSISQMATEVINNQHGNGHDNRRRSLGISQAEYEKVRAEVNRRAGGGSNAPTKSVDQMAREVLAGKHGNGHETRRKSLGISQAQYNQVRARVNQLA
ncbi:N-acetylmuramoyl-L-alanine amidase [Alkalihalobacillus sp. LMS6]|uniref:N-acetylmuramoyl-L-alanine amidase n=1 Tax=Alkalihalobacillus sp. LMS6 TaxID=2924034 RepID=UPI0020D05382|nr:N-acetylmuramoyl-L-alanine amidase [Alkalihalobacillus sp. LMS6]UTR05440.1 N-acetylmuramoyl-L-alanine amidase [Alkalihalobacillus sp. LMS6]